MQKFVCILFTFKNTYNIITISSMQNYFTLSKCIQPESFIVTHKKISQNRAKGKTSANTIYLAVKCTLWKKIFTWCCKFRMFFKFNFSNVQAWIRNDTIKQISKKLRDMVVIGANLWLTCPVLANIFWGYYETFWLNTFQEHAIILYRCYVDDIIYIFLIVNQMQTIFLNF